MGLFPSINQRTKILLPIRTNIAEYNEIPELTTIAANASISSTEDGPTVIARYRSLTINASCTLTTEYRCCGLVLVVDGDLTVNGTISMSARGAHYEPSQDHKLSNLLLPGSDILYEIDIPATADEIADFLHRDKGQYRSLEQLPAIYRPTLYMRGPNGSVYSPADLGTIPRVGGAGGASKTSAGVGNPGIAGTDRKCGGGGGGGLQVGGTSGAGGAGTCYSGGCGGGGRANNPGTAHESAVSINGSAYGGRGGDAYGTAGSNFAGSGAGNPAGYPSPPTGGQAGENGTGGLLVIICTGNITVGAGGFITANGKNGGKGNTSSSYISAGGGGSGGGSINLFYGSAYTNNGTVGASGGAGGTIFGANGYAGGSGGAGCVTTEKYTF